ncbi:hypothetical protein HD599_001213 [Conyzicola lurida]|uniref:Peptidase S8/S53 domain-containing protein n=1 Tax=Conyzicola lurida TaxID=1172621 RepID=A0A841AGE1_9MICO|nr:S8 family serine peptidase [Conyzicola lurida]MBB5842890.1 hypothetical protein [Conyzicola lurida]
MARTPSRIAADDWRLRFDRVRPRGAVLNPGTDQREPYPVYPTAYVTDRLLVSALLDDGGRTRTLLDETAAAYGWELVDDREYRAVLPVDDREREERRSRYPWATGDLGFVRVLLVARTGALPPDAWIVLRDARRRQGELDGGRLVGVGLDHILSVHAGFSAEPYHSTPYHSTPYHSTPYHSTPAGGFDPSGGGTPMGAYLFQGSGGRQPVTVVLPTPPRTEAGNRVIVATLDTGLGAHDWLDRCRRDLTGLPMIGYTDDADDPELHPDLVGPLDGQTDALTGHGTFIAGLVHQAAPDADIAAWRVVGADGAISESEVGAAITALATLIESATATPQGKPQLLIDVLSLSLGYYHETPEDTLIDITLAEQLLRIRRAGTVVVCSAGNDGTSRPMFPAAFGDWESTPADQVPWRGGADAAPLVSVGALNPNGSTALFSNTGAWVRCYAPGAAVVSTMPAHPGGAEPIARTTADARTRETVDADDFRGGFAVWSGTSFAAPVVAGRIAAALHTEVRTADRDDRVKRATRITADVLASTP